MSVHFRKIFGQESPVTISKSAGVWPTVAEGGPPGRLLHRLFAKFSNCRLLGTLALVYLSCYELKGFDFNCRSILLYEEDTFIGKNGKHANVVR